VRCRYGYASQQYVWSLVSGVGVFFMGCGLSVYHGVASLWHPAEINSENVPIALGILAVNLALECYSMQVAYKEIKREAAKSNITVRVCPACIAL
jgi:zinc transporter 9